MSDLYDKLREGGRSTKYSFSQPKQETTSRFRRRPNGPTSPTSAVTKKSTGAPSYFNSPRTDDVDRPYAYPPEKASDGSWEWDNPTAGEIGRDLLLRVVEVAIGAVAQEIAYFFTRRRFVSKERRHR